MYIHSNMYRDGLLPLTTACLLLQIFPDNACRREILNLDVLCGSSGCQWAGKLSDLEVSPK